MTKESKVTGIKTWPEDARANNLQAVLSIERCGHREAIQGEKE